MVEYMETKMTTQVEAQMGTMVITMMKMNKASQMGNELLEEEEEKTKDLGKDDKTNNDKVFFIFLELLYLYYFISC